MRARNLALVLGEVSRNGPVTRAALAEITGLTKTTVSKLVGDLLESGMVTESPPPADADRSRGRPGVAVRLRGDRVAALGLEINVDYLSVCVMDLTRTVRLRRTQAVDNRDSSSTDVVRNLRDLALQAVDEAAAAGLSVAGAALAVPGPVDPAQGLVHSAPNLGWGDVRPADLLDLPFPVLVDNEANLAALGELWFGSGMPDFLYVSGEIGIGAGLVFGGALFRGTRGFAGELGHVVVDPGGPDCRCGGRGCLERYAGQDALLDAAPDGLLDGLIRRLTAGDTRARAACEQAGRALGTALTSAVHLLDPGTIILGGIFAPLFPWLRGPAAEALRHIRHVVPNFAVAEAGPDAAVLGGAGQVIQQVIADPAGHMPRATAGLQT
ncbi:putative NBD/HSP70 family sugar kinase [Thermocatellispora tengchongensis]|uniref:Putative NBD/HSP70 family sugar kinase n=1 Tax=Thermocatellispora tengchongensis TaxID=1073253 RepID=A0A840NVN9_9ACTN|nr:ROK family transcriptional regulator [Thermocatellispora tengchongensis]MBB5130879.1 putative NBD/HSP70 family sugar kinase [Thermocatellispora tengchongensis]